MRGLYPLCPPYPLLVSFPTELYPLFVLLNFLR